MPVRIDQRAYGSFLNQTDTASAAEDAAKGALSDFDAAQRRTQAAEDREYQQSEREYQNEERDRIARERIEKKEAAQEDEIWEKTQITDDPADVLNGQLEESLISMRDELADIDDSTSEGRQRKREIYKSYANVNKGLASVNELLKTYREATGPGGTGIDGSTPVRVRKILNALDTNPGAFSLSYEDGQVRIKGDVDGEIVDEPMGDYLSNLRFSPKKNWDSTLNTAKSNIKSVDQVEGAVDSLLGGPRHDLLSLASHYGVSPEMIKEQNLTDDQIKDRIKGKITEDLTPQLKKKAEFTATDLRNFRFTTSAINSATTLQQLGSIDPQALNITEEIVDGEPTGQVAVTAGGTGTAGATAYFDATDIEGIKDFARGALLDKDITSYAAEQNQIRTNRLTEEFNTKVEGFLGNKDFQNRDDVQLNAPKPTKESIKGLSREEATAVVKLWQKNNPNYKEPVVKKDPETGEVIVENTDSEVAAFESSIPKVEKKTARRGRVQRSRTEVNEANAKREAREEKQTLVTKAKEFENRAAIDAKIAELEAQVAGTSQRRGGAKRANAVKEIKLLKEVIAKIYDANNENE